MNRKRKMYIMLVCLTIFLGITSRRIPMIPLYVGDILWAIMIFFIVRFLLIENKIRVIAGVSLLVCYLVEISQLYQAPWMNNIRNTILGRLILGQGFLWSDIIAYTVGIIMGTLWELIDE